MLIVCLLYATCTNLIPFLGRAAEVILLLSFILILKRTNYKFINDRLFLTLLASVLITIITWVNIKITYPELSSSTPDIRYFSRLLLFIPIGYWLQGKEKNIILIWSAFILSTFISTFTRGGGILQWAIWGTIRNESGLWDNKCSTHCTYNGNNTYHGHTLYPLNFKQQT